MHSPTQADIVVDRVGRSFGGVHAVVDASFTARAGEITALVGPNGSGKTTLLLMLASLLAPDRGTIRLGGVDPVADPVRARAQLGWMPDSLGTWAALTTRESLTLIGRLYGIPPRAAAVRAAELIDLLDLSPLADRPTKVLSRGQQQRLGLARALVHDPAILLLDEPASGLDPNARIALRDMLKRFAAEGRTILISSHILAELDEMADAAVFLEAGVTADDERVARARIATREWRVRALDAARLRAALTATGVAARDDGDAVLVPVTGERGAAELLASLVREGVEVSSFAPAVGELEHTFIDLSREDR